MDTIVIVTAAKLKTKSSRVTTLLAPNEVQIHPHFASATLYALAAVSQTVFVHYNVTGLITAGGVTLNAPAGTFPRSCN